VYELALESNVGRSLEGKGGAGKVRPRELDVMKMKGHHDGYTIDIPLGCLIRHYLKRCSVKARLESMKSEEAKNTMSSEAWAIFADRLFDELGQDLPGSCDGTLDKSKTILERMDEDAPNILAYCREHCAHCDCEVLLNVAPACLGLD
jgi:hypothetical protein